MASSVMKSLGRQCDSFSEVIQCIYTSKSLNLVLLHLSNGTLQNNISTTTFESLQPSATMIKNENTVSHKYIISIRIIPEE